MENGAKAKPAIANLVGQQPGPIIPRPPVPAKVQESVHGPKVRVEPKEDVGVEEQRVGKLLPSGAQGIITIHIFDNAPYQVDFEGRITGDEINVAWRAMYKQYKLWKHTQSKTGGK